MMSRTRQDRQAVDRQQADDLPPARQAGELGARRLERVGLNGLHARPACLRRSACPAIRPDARRGRGEQVLDRQIGGAELGHDAAAVEDQRAVADLGDLLEVGRDDDDRRAAPAAPRRTAGRSRPWRRRRRRRSDPRRRRPCRRGAASARRPPSADCRRRGARSAGRGRSAAARPAGRARATRRSRGAGAR